MLKIILQPNSVDHRYGKCIDVKLHGLCSESTNAGISLQSNTGELCVLPLLLDTCNSALLTITLDMGRTYFLQCCFAG